MLIKITADSRTVNSEEYTDPPGKGINFSSRTVRLFLTGWIKIRYFI